jgi:hypothetical protein
MTINLKEAQLAFELLNLISQLETILWSKYDKEFFDFIMDEQNNVVLKDALVDDNDIYPF